MDGMSGMVGWKGSGSRRGGVSSLWFHVRGLRCCLDKICIPCHVFHSQMAFLFLMRTPPLFPILILTLTSPSFSHSKRDRKPPQLRFRSNTVVIHNVEGEARLGLLMSHNWWQ